LCKLNAIFFLNNTLLSAAQPAITCVGHFEVDTHYGITKQIRHINFQLRCTIWMDAIVMWKRI